MVRRNIIALFFASATLVVNGTRPLKNRDTFGEEAASLINVASSAIASAFGTAVPLPSGAANLVSSSDGLAATQASSGQGATKTLTGHTTVEPTITPPSTTSSTSAAAGGASSASVPSPTSGFVTSVTSPPSSSASTSTSSSTPKPTTSHKNGASTVHVRSTNTMFGLVAVLGGAVLGAFIVL
ncbi:hypothetical protein BDP27DRAFT_1360788 [Rhodocollybia butyracea]|uniref:Uncharacterized protein n=1 Tax=Rhodocollybia butyracea TaxID=206335 RepID=A0A9P5PZE7_9AGAR|nr:hypothetical protein BDP27DRAFT_1360788 [Rhodocollybia butyracea]